MLENNIIVPIKTQLLIIIIYATKCYKNANIMKYKNQMYTPLLICSGNTSLNGEEWNNKTCIFCQAECLKYEVI